MRLFHVSEESNIEEFIPRTPLRDDLNKDIGLVWAISEEKLPNFLVPRDCPRVCYSINKHSTKEDQKKYFTSSTCSQVIIIENRWFERIKSTHLFLYEFNISNFVLQDQIAGYYVSKEIEKPIRKIEVSDCFQLLLSKNVEIRIVDSLFGWAEQVKNSSLDWSLCRMRNAKNKGEKENEKSHNR